jgi:hypothetical protein
MVLAAVAIDARRVIEKIDDAKLDGGSEQFVVEAADHEWHVTVSYSRQQGFVRISGHPHNAEQANALAAVMPKELAQLFSQGQQAGEFDFNCPVDWVPKS